MTSTPDSPHTTTGDDPLYEAYAEHDDAQDWDDEDDEDDDYDCGLMQDGQCIKAGSEECDFECPNRDSDLFAGSAAWCRKHGVNGNEH